ncbi:MAG TPA: vWA domain-containing protein, partial [Vicinamibacteria bacterium]|nr:vWA domain-containing protein [Vicinamibacteria bacterium]
ADQDTARDLAAVLEALASGPAGDGVVGQDPLGRNQPATDVARRLRFEVSDALMDLKDAVEPGWLKRVDSGRLNVRRLAGGACDPDALFDRYEPGHLDATELELVLLLDVSGSMSSQVLALGEATWAIRHAVDDLEGTATVITWSTGPHRVLAEPGNRPDDRMFVPDDDGGTDPSSALAEAYRLLAGSTARNRLVVILTDGQWHLGRHAQLIPALNHAGVTTVCATLGAWGGNDFHGCTHGRRIDAPADLARLFRDVAAAGIGAWS